MKKLAVLRSNTVKGKDYVSTVLSKNITKDQRAILTKLRKCGIKEYMCKHFNHDQCDEIDLLYHLSRQYLGNQLAKITSLHYHGDDQSATTKQKTTDKEKLKKEMKNNNIVARRFWSCNDVVIKTFQYLNLSSLNACSLVCINFLGHSYNPSSIHHLMITYEPKSDGSSICLNTANEMRLRDWHRFTNCKHLDLVMWGKGDDDKLLFSQTFINGVLSLKQVEILNCRFQEYEKQVVDFIRKLSQPNTILNNIKELTFSVTSELSYPDDHELKNCQFKSINCEKCSLSNVFFKVILSNKCHNLMLNYNTLDENVRYLEMKNDEKNDDVNVNTNSDSCSDLSGVKTLTLNGTNFYHWDSASNLRMNDVNNSCWESMCSQFTNLENVILSRKMKYATDAFSCWQELMAHSNANKGRVIFDTTNLSIVLTLSKNKQMNKFIAKDVSISNLPSWVSIVNVKKWLKQPFMYENINSLTVKVFRNGANDALNGFFNVLKMDEETNYTKPLTRQLAPHQVFSKLKTKQDFEKQGIFPGSSDKCLVGWRVTHGDIKNDAENNDRGDNNDVKVNSNDNDNDSSDKYESIVKALIVMINSSGRAFVHYNSMDKYFGTKSKGGWHNLPNDNLYPASCVESNYKLISNLNLDWPYWYDNALKLNCICVQTGLINGARKRDWEVSSKPKLECVGAQTLDNIVLFVMGMNKNKCSKELRDNDYNRIGLDISGYCDLYDDKKIVTNLFGNIKKLILLSIPINFSIIIVSKDKKDEIKYKQLFKDFFNSVFGNISEWYKIPVCNEKFWKVFDKPKIEFTCRSIKMFGKMQQGECLNVQTADRT